MKRKHILILLALTLCSQLGFGQFGARREITTEPYIVHACDLDNDGDIDILSSSYKEHSIAWYENEGGGVFNKKQLITNKAYYSRSLYTSDLDGDGYQDILSVSNDDKVAWYKNEGNGNFSNQIIISTDGGTSIYSCDIDNDGDQDILLGSGNIVWYKNDGAGNFGTQQLISTTGSFNIYPNPASDYIKIEYAMLDKNDNVTINVIDMQGKILKTIKSDNQIDVLRISLSDLSSGNYNIQFISAKQGHYTVKITKK